MQNESSNHGAAVFKLSRVAAGEFEEVWVRLGENGLVVIDWWRERVY